MSPLRSFYPAPLRFLALARFGDTKEASLPWDSVLSTDLAMVSSRMAVSESIRSRSGSVDAGGPDVRGRDTRICTWCGNRSREVCVPCQQEAEYRHLEPAPLEHWEQPPELLSMRELVDLPAAERLALIWLSVRYSQILGPPGDL